MVRDAQKIAQSSGIIYPEQACQSLVDAANEAGGEDNIGVVVVKVT